MGSETDEGETERPGSVAVSRRVAYLDASDATTLTSAFVAQLRASFGLPSASPTRRARRV